MRTSTLRELTESPTLARDLFAAGLIDGEAQPVGKLNQDISTTLLLLGWVRVAEWGGVYLTCTPRGYLHRGVPISRWHLVRADADGLYPWAVEIALGSDRVDWTGTDGRLFDTGLIDVTATAGALLIAAGVECADLLHRHVTGDWGDVTDDWATANVNAVAQGGRVLSRYALDGEVVIVLTDADRASTRVMANGELVTESAFSR
jgi:hypothetical protein